MDYEDLRVRLELPADLGGGVPLRGLSEAEQLGAAPLARAQQRVSRHEYDGPSELGASSGSSQPAAGDKRPRSPRGSGGSARASAKCALHLFSGPKLRPEGLAARLRARGWEVDEKDSGKVPDHPDDLLRDDVFFALLGKAERGDYQAVVAGVPCTTFSVARFKPGGAPVVRRHSGHQSRGLRNAALERLPVANRSEADQANELAWRAAAIAQAVQRSGGVFIIENPVDRNGPPSRRRSSCASRCPSTSRSGSWRRCARCRGPLAASSSIFRSAPLEGARRSGRR